MNGKHGISRRSFLATLAGTGLLACGSYGYATRLEPEWLEVSRRRVPLSGLKHPVRVAHLSDFHVEDDEVSFPRTVEAFRLAEAEKPDLFVLTGDFVTLHAQGYAEYRDLLAGLAERYPTFACLGNHDYYGRLGAEDIANQDQFWRGMVPIQPFLEHAHVMLLKNEARTLTVREQPLIIAGLDDLWHGYPEPRTCLWPKGKEPENRAPTIVLAHNPDTKAKLTNYAWELLLCGHTHGGQVKVPLINYAPHLPVRDRRYVDGLYRWNNRWLHITRGVGTLHDIRFNCRPEVAILNLVPEG